MASRSNSKPRSGSRRRTGNVQKTAAMQGALNFTAPANAKRARQPMANHGGAVSSTTRGNSKQARVLDALAGSNGMTIAAIMTLTGWQQHSVRGFLAGVVRKRLGLQLTSELADGQRIYRIASQTAPKQKKS